VYAEFLMNLAKLGQSFKKDNCSLEPPIYLILLEDDSKLDPLYLGA